jgi:hypothetical protein
MRMELREVGCLGVNCVYLHLVRCWWRALVDMEMKLVAMKGRN